MRWVINQSNWRQDVVDKVRRCSDGDEIVVKDWDQLRSVQRFIVDNQIDTFIIIQVEGEEDDSDE